MSGLAGTPQFLRIALRVVIETLHFHKAQTGLFSMTTLFHIKGALGKTWNGMEWIGMEWNGLEWNGMEWIGMEWISIISWVLERNRLFISNLPTDHE